MQGHMQRHAHNTGCCSVSSPSTSRHVQSNPLASGEEMHALKNNNELNGLPFLPRSTLIRTYLYSTAHCTKLLASNTSTCLRQPRTSTITTDVYLYTYGMLLHVPYTYTGCILWKIPYSGYFSGGKIFVVFVVERRTTKSSTHETVPHSTRVWFSIP